VIHRSIAQIVSPNSSTLLASSRTINLRLAFLAPDMHDGSPAMLKALEQAEAAWERAMDKIAERAGLTKGPDTRR